MNKNIQTDFQICISVPLKVYREHEFGLFNKKNGHKWWS